MKQKNWLTGLIEDARDDRGSKEGRRRWDAEELIQKLERKECGDGFHCSQFMFLDYYEKLAMIGQIINSNFVDLNMNILQSSNPKTVQRVQNMQSFSFLHDDYWHFAYEKESWSGWWRFVFTLVARSLSGNIYLPCNFHHVELSLLHLLNTYSPFLFLRFICC